MQIAHIDVQNFRKLKECRIELAPQQTIFVGANNSGKTSAMDALIAFLKESKRKTLSTTDFTLSNWLEINRIGEQWVTEVDQTKLDLSVDRWRTFLPSIDVWLAIEEHQIHYVSHLLPTLDWTGGLLGVRLVLEPSDVENLYKEFRAAHTSAQDTISAADDPNNEKKTIVQLWPKSMRDFLDRHLHKQFAVRAYILDPSKADEPKPQSLPENSEPLDGDPFAGLFKIDIINAQRGFSDPGSTETGAKSDRRLSSQLRTYFDKHLDPKELPDAKDLEALEAIEAARTAFDKKLKESFSSAISELEGLNYPGFSDPQIILSSRINPIENLNHDSAVQYRVVKTENEAYQDLCLPERFNGLGYQNLISMIFNLIRYRDEWMRVGKAGKRDELNDEPVEPLHIILIEEPEAHLHAQVQQVFVKKAYGVLRHHPRLKDNSNLSTQLVISTHSSHIAHETDFTSLRYFQRQEVGEIDGVPYATVVNMTSTFGADTDTARFSTRYLRTTHCDLFFADAAILVEGPAERMLLPHFIRHQFPALDKSYVCILEIGGSHAHRLRPLIEALGLLTLVVTDLDSIEADSYSKVRPETGKDYRTGNDTLKKWIPAKTALDELVVLPPASKISADKRCRVAYPDTINVDFSGNSEPTIPYTFEDALALENLKILRTMTDKTGLLKKLAEAVNKSTLHGACEAMFIALDGARKAEMALELLFVEDPSHIKPPKYISEGLEWLRAKLNEGGITPGATE